MKLKLKVLLAFFLVACNLPVVSGQFFLPHHPFIAPEVDEELGFSRHRSPCPGLNTLANHGYINRNGAKITFRSVADAAEKVFGMNRSIIHGAGVVGLRRGMTSVHVNNSDGTSELAFNLFDLYTNNIFQGEGRIARRDEYFEKFAQFNKSIFEALAERGRDGVLFTSDVIEHRVERILEAKRSNPNAFASSTTTTSEYAAAMALDLFFLACFGQDPDLKTVPTEFLRSFLQDNKIPDSYLPRQLRDLELVSKNDPDFSLLFEETVKELEAALDTSVGHENSSDLSMKVVVGVSVAVAVLIVTILLVFLFVFKARQNVAGSKPASTRINRAVDQTSHDDSQDDGSEPLEQRDPKNLSWENVLVAVKRKKSAGNDSVILSNVSGCAPSGQLTCILGHSGSGKSTLLKILGGRHSFSKSKNISFTGVVKINGREIDPDAFSMSNNHGLAYVGQDDSFFDSVTPREAIQFSARLRLPRNTSKKLISDLTRDILTDLKLTQVQDRVATRMGGLSGGEKRRVSLGLELVTRPQVLLLDEVTSGLDSHSACVVTDICRDIAHKKRTAVAMVIHQPNSVIFSMMERIIIMKDGCCMYEGTALDVGQYFEDRGFPVPDTFSTPDWILEVSQENSLDVLRTSGFSHLEQTEDSLSLSEPVFMGVAVEGVCKRGAKERVTMATEIRELFNRELLILKRDPLPRLKEFGTIFALSLIVGIVFGGVGKNSLDDPQAFSSHVGAVFTVTFSCAIMTIASITSTVNSRSRFCREYISGHYRLLSYGIVMLIFELGFVFMCACVYTVAIYWLVNFNGRFPHFFGIIIAYAAVSSALGFAFTSLFVVADHGQSHVPFVVGPQLLLSGFLVTKASLASWIRWMVWLQPLTFGFRLILNEEFAACQEFSREEQLHFNCAKAFQAGLSAVKEGNAGAVYDSESVLTLMQGGQYTGSQAILEYFSFLNEGQNPFSLLWDHCSLQDSEFLSVNEVGEGHCDVTFASVSQARINSNFKTLTPSNTDFLHTVLGRKMRVNYPDDLSSFTIQKESLFLPPTFFEFVYENSRSMAMSSSVCEVQESFCPYEYHFNNYTDLLDCVEKMEDLPITTISDADLYTVDGNSTGCRQLHSSMAVLSPEVHCPHLSFTAMEDMNGKTKCSVSSNYAFEDFFTEDDFVLFQRTAQASGLNYNTYFMDVDLTREKGVCSTSLVGQTTLQSIRGLPDNLWCYSYLETQQATDEDGLITTYWISLFAFLVFYCLGGLLLLRRRAFD